MPTFEVKMPKLGESITQGTIMKWAVKVGDIVQEDDVLFEVSTEKVSAEVPSPVDGKVLEIHFSENDVVPVGTVVVVIEMKGNPEQKASEKSTPQETRPTDDIKNLQITEAEKSTRFYSPLVRSIAQAEHISEAELDSITGTGFQGRVNKTDVLKYLESRKTGGKPSSPKPPVAVTQATQSSGTVTSEDTVVEMDRVRRIIADHMVMSKKVSPHVTTIVEADVTKLVQWRERVKDIFFRQEGVKLTYMPAIVEACTKALMDFPRVNVSVDGYNIIFKKRINVGIAVALDDGNLIVPVIHDANNLNINGLAVAIDSLAVKARSNKLSPDDIQGGTFSITNFGTFKNIIGTPIINQPQVAILGVGYVEKKPAVVETSDGDVIAIRHKMYLSLSYDHRAVDGALGGAFVRRIADYLEMERV